jgi:putative transcriptional regulator
MAKAKFGISKKDTAFGRDLIAAAREALAHKRGKIALPTRVIDPMTPAHVKAIRRKVAKSPKEFERRFGVPARTLEGWEQNKKVDVAGRVLLMVIEKDPEAVERALSAG